MFVFRRRPDKRDLDLSDMISARIDFLAVFRRRPDKRDLAVPVLVVVIPVPHSYLIVS